MVWPAYELVTFPNVNEIRSAGTLRDDLASTLSGSGVPRDCLNGAVFRADARLSWVTRPDGSQVIRFGEGRLRSTICLDPASGRVIAVWIGAANQVAAGEPNWSEGFVNSSLDQFRRTIEAVTASFPFYARETGDLGHRDAAARSLGRTIASIDALAHEPDVFWSTFTDDVAIGDFATEDVTGSTPSDLEADHR